MIQGAVLVTGAAGWVGRSVVAQLSRREYTVRAASRGPMISMPGVRFVHYPGLELAAETSWHEALLGVDTVVHCAARVHVMRDEASNPLVEYRRVNVIGTLRLVRQAATVGVRRFVFLSTAHVNGIENQRDQPFTADQLPRPETPYGLSKWEAEQGLAAIARESAMEFVVLRPPLVVGPGVGGNLRGLISTIARGVPLPLKNIDNRRSLIGLSDLVDAIEVCITHPGASDRTFLVGDPEQISTPDLVGLVARHLGRPARLFGIPLPLVRALGKTLGRTTAVRSLWGSLQLDCSATYKAVDWVPSCGIPSSLASAVSHFMREAH